MSAFDAAPFFRPQEPVPESGVYRVFHGDHRLAHEVTLLRGETFPRCRTCGDTVHFQLLLPAPRLDDTPGFKVRLYEIPHPETKAA